MLSQEGMIKQQTLSLRTRNRIALLDITGLVESVVEKSEIEKGLTFIFTPHTTAGLLINEAEGGLIKDIESMLQELIPWGKPYQHNRVDSNTPAHLLGALLGCSVYLPIQQGRLALGTWQALFFVELDGPRSRQVKVQLIGEL